MVYYLYRSHILPMDVKNVAECVTRLYSTSIRKNDVAMTTYDMNKQIRKRWRRYDVWSDQSIELTLPNMDALVRTIESESIDQYYFDMKPSDVKYTVLGRSVNNHVECSICKHVNGSKIELLQCLCTFHRECIETSLKYSRCCPVCQTSINTACDIDIDATTEKTKTKTAETNQPGEYDRIYTTEAQV